MRNSLSALRALPLRQVLRRAVFKFSGRVITLSPQGAVRGRVLISYTTLPFLDTREKIVNGHSNRWECHKMAETFLKRGYIVDVIDFNNTTFKPTKKYNYCIDVEYALERLAPLLNPECILIFHATAAHWLFWNTAETARLFDIQKRRGATILPQRVATPTHGPDLAHIILSLCGTLPEATFKYLNKEIFHVQVSSSHTYPKPQKNFDAARRQFIWFGGSGVVRKGLDIVLEAFAGMPELTLLVCGKYGGETDFTRTFEKELLHTPNIKALGYMDPESDTFKNILKDSLGIVYPSSAEGCATSVLLAMHGGLIPILSRETGVETGDFGTLLDSSSIDSVQKAVRALAAETPAQLEQRALKTWEYATTHHSRDAFARSFSAFVDRLEQPHGN